MLRLPNRCFFEADLAGYLRSPQGPEVDGARRHLETLKVHRPHIDILIDTDIYIDIDRRYI
jgi:hypothetical protein